MVRNSGAVRALVQRVSEASVEVAGEAVSAIGPGLLVLVAAGAGDTPKTQRGWRARSPGFACSPTARAG